MGHGPSLAHREGRHAFLIGRGRLLFHDIIIPAGRVGFEMRVIARRFA